MCPGTEVVDNDPLRPSVLEIATALQVLILVRDLTIPEVEPDPG